MFSVVIATHDSERALVTTLAALVPGATAGIVRDVIVADGGSNDETAQVAEIAGCRFLASSEPLGARLAAAVREARGPWLMFLAAGTVPEPTWIDEITRFVETSELRGEARAAVFSARRGGAARLLRRIVGALPAPAQGLMISRLLYAEIGGHRAAAAEPRNDLLRRIGGRRLVTLRSVAVQVGPDR